MPPKLFRSSTQGSISRQATPPSSEILLTLESVINRRHDQLTAQVNNQFTTIRKQVGSVDDGLRTAATAQKMLQSFVLKLESMHEQQQNALQRCMAKLEFMHDQQQEMARLLTSGQRVEGPLVSWREAGAGPLEAELEGSRDCGTGSPETGHQAPVQSCTGSASVSQIVDGCEDRLRKLQDQQTRELSILLNTRLADVAAREWLPTFFGHMQREPSLAEWNSKVSVVPDKELKGQALAMKRLFSTRTVGQRASCTERVAQAAEAISVCLLLANIAWMAFEAELSMDAVVQGMVPPTAYYWVNFWFAVAFSAEVFFKIAFYRKEFITGPSYRWNIFDMVLVGFQIIDLVMSSANLTVVRALRGIRAMRATRIIRTVKIVPQLRLMVASLSCSAGSLFWAFVLLVLVMFLCAMGVQQTVYSAVEDQGLAVQHPRLLELYGSLVKTMLSLFMAISGGDDWKQLAEPLEHISPLFLLFYALFVMLVVFGLLNVLTAVFVEATANIAQSDQELAIQDSLDKEASTVKQLMAIFVETDVGGSGTVSRKDFAEKLEDPRFRAQMKMMDLDIFQAQDIFSLVDTEGTDAVDIEDLVFGLMRLKGSARAMDMAMLQHNNTRLLSKFVAFTHKAESTFRELRAAVHARQGLSASPRISQLTHTSQQSAEGVPCCGIGEAFACQETTPGSSEIGLPRQHEARRASGEALHAGACSGGAAEDAPPSKASHASARPGSAIEDVLRLINMETQLLRRSAPPRGCPLEEGSAAPPARSEFAKSIDACSGGSTSV